MHRRVNHQTNKFISHKLHNSSMTLLKFILLLLCSCFVSVSMTPMTVYNSACFDSIDVRFRLDTLLSVSSINTCACQCYHDSMCVTGSFFGVNQTCVLFSAHLWQGQLQLMNNAFASVFSFPNRTTIICKSTKYFI